MKLYAIVLLALMCAACTHNATIGDQYVGKLYQNNPLGEDIAPDADPIIRFDAFDCTTFVETALADGNVDKLNKIRYKNGVINFMNRNHFIETDWLENNSDFVANVSPQYALTATRHVIIDKKKWFRTVYNIDTDFARRDIDLEYIPYANVNNIHISEPMIVLFIIDNKQIRNKIGTDLAVRHMGFLLPDGRLRHASQTLNRVVDVDFYEYVNTMVKNPNNLGIVLVEIKK